MKKLLKKIRNWIYGAEFASFNLNESILVRLTDLGYQRLADIHNSYIGRIPNWDRRDADFYKQRADAHGYTNFQAWCFIRDFGDVTGFGWDAYYLLDVKIKVKSLKKINHD